MGPEQAVDDAMQRICAGSVSTHALREESDKFEGDDHGIDAKISIHALREESDSKSSEKIQCFCSIIHACAQFEKELYKGSGKMQNKSC